MLNEWIRGCWPVEDKDFTISKIQLNTIALMLRRQIVLCQIPTIIPSRHFILENNLRLFKWMDAKGRELCLKPEGTRLLTLWTLARKGEWYYWERMFRYERPQEGRRREFIQFGYETSYHKKRRISGVFNGISIAIEWLIKNDLHRVVEVRINFLNNQSRQMLISILRILNQKHIIWKYDGQLTRGLGYYTGIVFECWWRDTNISILSGGEYDHMDPYTNRFGWAAGITRTVELMGVRSK